MRLPIQGYKDDRERRKANLATHSLVKTGDSEARADAQDRFPPFCDRNGEVVLGFCRRCHGAEAELEDQTCLDRLLRRAIEAEAKLPPLQRAINSIHQKMSWVLAESMMNDDASPNGRTREEAVALLERVSPEFVVLTELERLMAAIEKERAYIGQARAHADEGGTIGEAAARSLLEICERLTGGGTPPEFKVPLLSGEEGPTFYSNLYTDLAASTGVARTDVKKVILALAYSRRPR